MSPERQDLDLRSLLTAVEQTFPVDVVDVLSTELARTVEARHVAMLMANFSGNALVRLSHVDSTGGKDAGHNERAEAVLLPGTIHEEVVLAQSPRVIELSDGWLVLVPVTERGTLRNRRRALASPAEQADAAGESLRIHAKPDQFVTGLLMRIRLVDGSAEVVNAGHPAPFLVREGRILPLDVTAQQPLGVALTAYSTDRVTLMAGDRLLVITDGYLERDARRVDLEGILAAAPDRHPRQVVQELAHNLLNATGGHLQDDATALCLDWYGPSGTRRATGGASQARATA